MSSEDGGRLARWARRKAEVRQRRGAAAPAIPDEPVDVPARQAEPQDAAPAAPHGKAPPLGASDLPDVESLGAESDFAAFMKDGVPAELQRLALRKLWASDPAFNVIDEMVEYGEDYTDAATVVAGMKSAWEAGRGYAGETVEQDADDPDAPKKGSPEDAGDRNVDTFSGEQTAADEDLAEDDSG